MTRPISMKQLGFCDVSDRHVVGRRFGRLTVQRTEKGRNGAPGRNGRRAICECDCGQAVNLRFSSLLSGVTQSCGCLQREATAARCRARATHGHTRRVDGRSSTPEFRSWKGMKERCSRPIGDHAARYHDRGIRVCDRWRESFENFLADMGLRPSPRHSIDRIDNNGNYEPGNCRWATTKEQACNRTNSRRIKLDGMAMTIAEAAERTGLKFATIYSRLEDGWSDDEALTLSTSRKRDRLGRLARTTSQQRKAP